MATAAYKTAGAFLSIATKLVEAGTARAKAEQKAAVKGMKINNKNKA
jgi:hypothetical protein